MKYFVGVLFLQVYTEFVKVLYIVFIHTKYVLFPN